MRSIPTVCLNGSRSSVVGGVDAVGTYFWVSVGLCVPFLRLNWGFVGFRDVVFWWESFLGYIAK